MVSEEVINSLYDSCFDKINEIVAICNEQFGEDRVDLQIPEDLTKNKFKNWYTRHQSDEGLNCKEFFGGAGLTILIHWPKVTISNEAGNTHLIKDLFAKISITIGGKLLLDTGFMLNRATFTDAEWQSDYAHSHIPGIGKGNLQEFLRPCLGSGPIKASIAELKSHYDKDWFEEFIFELSRYVNVESIAGVPYRKMNNISLGGGNNHIVYISFYTARTLIPSGRYKTLVKDFVNWLLANFDFHINYNGYKFVWGYTTVELWLTLSNAFIDWYNINHSRYGYTLGELLANNIIFPATIINNNVYAVNDFTVAAPIGTKILTFKGRDILLNVEITANTARQENVQYLLERNIIPKLQHYILAFLNYYYDR